MGCFHQIPPLKDQGTQQKWEKGCKSQRELEDSKETKASKHNLTSACMNSETGSTQGLRGSVPDGRPRAERRVDIGSIPNPEAISNR